MTKEKKKPGRKPSKKPAAKQITTAETKGIAVRKTQAPARESMTEAKIIEAFDALGITSKLDAQRKKLFIAVAREFNLNPLRREIHAVKMGGGDDEEGGGVLVPVVGYEVYIDRAEETGRLEYWMLEESGQIDHSDWRKSTYAVTVIIKRRDWPREFRWTVRYVEAVGLKWNKTKGGHQPNSMWQKRGHFMTQKCAIGQSFRLVFREILRGMPYIDAEVENAEAGDNHNDEDRGPLKEPQALKPVAPAPEPAPEKESPVQFPAGPYAQIMILLNERVKSKEGTIVSLFGGGETVEWKHKADGARNNPEELADVLYELDSVAKIRRETVKGEA